MQPKARAPIALCMLLLATPCISEQTPGPAPQPSATRRYGIRPTESKIRVDGVLDEEVWKTSDVITLPTEWTPGDNALAPVNTECMVTYDRSNIYVAFRCHESQPGSIRAHLMERDNTLILMQDDHVRIFLDTFNDQRRAFEFRVNPLGVQADAIMGDQEYEDFSWDAIWDSAGRLTESGYAIEMAIPFNQLRFPQAAGEMTWGFSAERSWPRNERHRMESHTRDRNNDCLPCQFNKISGISDISGGVNLELDPTLTANRTDQRTDFPDGSMTAGDAKVEPGLTARWGMTSNLMLSGAANPDFSQVEADSAQLDVNTRYALYYPEKRPFFLEGADYFLTPFEAVFTRTVADPVWGAKLTGKVGRNALGVFTTEDRINNLLLPSNAGSELVSIPDHVDGAVLRGRRDLGQSSTIGALYTGRIGDDYHNHVAGLDSFVRIGMSDSFNFQYLRSETAYPDDFATEYAQKTGNFGGDALWVSYDHQDRHWLVNAAFQSLGPDFRSDAGFVPRVDTRMLDSTVQYTFWNGAGNWYQRLFFWVRGYRITNHDGLLTDSRVALGAGYEGPLQTEGTAIARINEERYDGVLYRLPEFLLDFNLRPRGGLLCGLSAVVGQAVDYSNSRPADNISFNPFVIANVGPHLNVTLDNYTQRLSHDGGRIYTANLLQTKFVYNFNVKTAVRAILQYLNVDRDPAQYDSDVDSRTRSLFSQFLFSYKFNPQTVLFLGYSDNSDGTQVVDLTRADRTFFLKLGYAIVR